MLLLYSDADADALLTQVIWFVYGFKRRKITSLAALVLCTSRADSSLLAVLGGFLVARV